MPPTRAEDRPPRESVAERRPRGDELGRYRRACQEVDRLLDQGRLSEAVALNEEARVLFRRLFCAGELG